MKYIKKRSFIIFFIILIVILISYVFGFKYIGNISYKKLNEIVKREALLFNNDSISTKLLEELSKYKVIIIGEYHNIKEHEVFLYQLSTSLNKEFNYNKLLIETPQAFSWIFEDYSLGIMTEVDEMTAKKFWFYIGELKKIREHNLTMPENKRLKVSTIDINHSPFYFVTSLEYMQKFINKPDILLGFINYLKEKINNDNDYYNKINEMKNNFDQNSIEYKEQIGEMWYERIIKMIEVEINSIECRNYLKNNKERKRNIQREEYIKKIVDNHLRDTQYGVIINVGANHAQKTPARGTQMEWVAQYLHKKSQYAKGNTYSLFVIPAKGTVGSNKSGNLENSIFKNELFKVIYEYSNNKRAFLSFVNNSFINEKTLMNFHYDKKSLYPKELYDGVVVLPTGTYFNPFDKNN